MNWAASSTASARLSAARCGRAPADPSRARVHLAWAAHRPSSSARRQANLSSDSTQVLTKFGAEYEVTTFTDAPLTKSEWGKRNATRVGVTNHWAFTTSA